MHALFLALVLNTAPTFHYGPSMSLYEARLSGEVAQLTPGLGIQAEFEWQDGLSLGAMLFGSALGLGTASPGATVSVAPFICYDPSTKPSAVGACIGPGFDVDGTQGGLLRGFTWKRNFFAVGSLHTHF